MPLYETPISYVKTALLSIAFQRIVDKITLTIIDDCSATDYSSIIDMFSSLIDINYVKLSENKGVGYARQYGINATKNKYIAFIDSDDSFYNEYSLEILYEDIVKKNYDFVSGKFIREYLSDDSDEVSSNLLPLSQLRLGTIAGNNKTWVYSRLFSREFLGLNNIDFNDMRYDEDVAFMQSADAISENNHVIDNTVYVQHCNLDSISRCKDGEFTENINGLIKFVEALSYSHLKKRENGIVSSEKSKIQMCDAISVLYWYLVKCYYEFDCVDFEAMVTKVQEYYNLVIKDFPNIEKSDLLQSSYFSSMDSMSEISRKYYPTFSFIGYLDDLKENSNKVEDISTYGYELG